MATCVCPWWLGYFLINPLRRLYQDPRRILEPYIRNSMVVLDVGCAMGYFTLPMAKLVGGNGRVIAIDLQERMIKSLLRRAEKAGILHKIETRLCTSSSLRIDDLTGQIDFVLAFAVLHEIPDLKKALTEIAASLKSGGILLIAEPKGHLSEKGFATTISSAEECGLIEMARPAIRGSRSIVMARK
jgi:2-polyprenyl-3-methyl-5-hydroxy-6-metoxy-1,4-benzoquinol methylase